MILSCAALAAVATTAVSTTFAWYTANTTVTATPVNAASANSGSDLLMIADGISATTSGTTTTYAAITDLDSLVWKQQVAPTVTNNELKPLAYNSNGKILVNDLTTDPTTATSVSEVAWNSASATYATFILYFKNASTTDGQKLYVNGFTVTNKTASLPSKTIVDLASNYAAFGWESASASTYTVDALRVLEFDIESHQIVGGTAGASTETDYDVEKLATLKSDSLSSGYNAHTYYNAVMENDLSITTDKTVKTELGASAAANYTNALYLGTLPDAGTADTINDCLMVTFKVFLNGWDLACFDACQGQNFQFTFSFTTDAPTSTTATKFIYYTVSA